MNLRKGAAIFNINTVTKVLIYMLNDITSGNKKIKGNAKKRYKTVGVTEKHIDKRSRVNDKTLIM